MVYEKATQDCEKVTHTSRDDFEQARDKHKSAVVLLDIGGEGGGEGGGGECGSASGMDEASRGEKRRREEGDIDYADKVLISDDREIIGRRRGRREDIDEFNQSIAESRKMETQFDEAPVYYLFIILL